MRNKLNKWIENIDPVIVLIFCVLLAITSLILLLSGL